VQDHKSLARVIASANRNHQCVAVGGTVSWVNVNVLTVKAMGAVIGVAVAADGLHAVKTIKVLDPSLKLPFITHAESPWLLLFGPPQHRECRPDNNRIDVPVLSWPHGDLYLYSPRPSAMVPALCRVFLKSMQANWR